MSRDETPQPKDQTATGPETENSLDELLDSVRDHLDTPPMTEDDIPVLTEVVLAGPTATDSGTENEQSPASAAIPAEEHEAQATAASSAEEATETPGSTVATDTDRPAQGADHFPPAGDIDESTNALQSGFDASLDSGIQSNQTEQVTEDPLATLQTDWVDQAGEEFDATQVVSFAENSSAELPVMTADEADPAGDETRSATDSAEILEQFEQIIDERCKALADELKRQLRDLTEISANRDPVDPEA